MGFSFSLPDRNYGRLSGINSSENGAASDPKNLRVKLVLLGDSCSKSCIVLCFVHVQCDPTSKFTIGASFLSQTIALQDSMTVKFEIWDTAGQERYAALAPLYYRGAGVAGIVYDITSPESFNKAQHWVKSYKSMGVLTWSWLHLVTRRIFKTTDNYLLKMESPMQKRMGCSLLRHLRKLQIT